MVGYQQAEAALLGLIMVVPVAIVFLVAQRYVIGGAYTGSIKGKPLSDPWQTNAIGCETGVARPSNRWGTLYLRYAWRTCPVVDAGVAVLVGVRT